MKHWLIQKFSGKTLLIASVSIVTFLSLFLSAQAYSPFEGKRTSLPLPDLTPSSDKETSDKSQEQAGWQKHSVKIGKNESLSTALDSLKISPATTYAIGRLKNSKKLTNLRVGDKLTIWVDKHYQLQKILYPKSKTLSYELVKTDTSYQIEEKVEPVEIRTHTAVGTIKGAFYIAGKKAGLSARSIMNLSDLFSWDIDFSRELQSGDTFKVIYEAKYLKGKYIGDAKILAAQITTNKGREKHNAFIVRDGKKLVGYYDEKGKNLKKAFLRSPVDYVRITSKYNPKRYHPVLKRTRPHRGVDYGGPKGTPIRATGDGKISFKGWGTGYGRHIKIKHAGRYTTLYGHMSRYGKVKHGQYVKQGQVIGYMGKTGLATGVHLHYEFRVRNRHVDPLKVKFPDAGPVPKKYRAEHKQTSTFLLTQLDRLDTTTQFVQRFE